ncbi:MAG: 50S ribosomal protein L17 [Chlamydiae bacterium RIFCSPHIGHO2_12_FULL_27_8]|nr:MAG: 50S ribosomal protein L17 [Chlamydiae bacterium RIFCSPHIGHO2_12_FULL_27_8]
MRHAKKTFKIGRTSSHRRCLIANMLKSLIENEKIVTTTTKAKELKRHADKIITIAKEDSLHARRKAISTLMIRYNPLSSKERKEVKAGDTSSYNTDRKTIQKLFSTLKTRFESRNGGYTRIIKLNNRVGDAAQNCYLEFLQ